MKKKAVQSEPSNGRPRARNVRVDGRKRKSAGKSAGASARVRARSKKSAGGSVMDEMRALMESIGILRPVVEIAPPPQALKAKKDRYLEELANGETQITALGRSGLKWEVVRRWLAPKDKEYDEVFAAGYELAKAAGDDMDQFKLEHVAKDHAQNGVVKPVYQAGRFAGLIREFDHELLFKLLRAGGKGKYDERGHGGFGAPPPPGGGQAVDLDSVLDEVAAQRAGPPGVKA